ncbi:DUF2087 domain-containing protein [Brachybacterium sp. J144]|uniref:DUF2087 domain-containing protein n=1 Tax=Brachybacterium sp. J144 TaxID=3116487 RepID=UPI002E77AF29|nr:DUF2087 domain-containing protein [Brachybacterium sp. J144]MEE1650128.1 DUF2087 domain-containing protein [Brachybacterium sp. J144]
MCVAPDHAAELGRVRMMFSLLSTPKLRRGLGRRLAGRVDEGVHAPEDPSVSGPLSRLDWLGPEGDVDLDALRRITNSLALMRSDRAILEVPRVDGIPVRTEESREVSGRIARLVFERIGPERQLSEPELNAAIAMFAADVALVRRDAVDAGVLERSADGAVYRLVG